MVVCSMRCAAGPRLARERRTVRFLIAIVGVLVLLGGLGAVKGAQFAALAGFGREQEELGPPPEAVAVATVTEQHWETILHAVGTLTSERGVTISPQVAGAVTRIHFQSGEEVKKGDVLVELDTEVEKAELASALARERLAEREAERTRALVPAGAAPEADLDAAEAELDTARAQVSDVRARIGLKTIRAPFSGRLGIREVNLGQYLAPGDTISVLETSDTMFVDFTLPQEHLKEVAVGLSVRVSVADGRPIVGTIFAVEPALDAGTRAIPLRAIIPRVDGRLRSGMFVDVQVVLPRKEPYLVVPATAIVHAPYGNSVFVVEDKPQDEPGMRETPDGAPVFVVRQQFVRTGPRRGDFVAVLEGLTVGEPVVMAGAFKLRNHSPVIVTDTAMAEPRLDPQPENR